MGRVLKYYLSSITSLHAIQEFEPSLKFENHIEPVTLHYLNSNENQFQITERWNQVKTLQKTKT